MFTMIPPQKYPIEAIETVHTKDCIDQFVLKFLCFSISKTIMFDYL